MCLLKSVRVLFSITIILLVSACGPKDDKYHENEQDHCQSSKVGNEFIAHWYTAEPTLVMTEDIKGYIDQHRHEIDFIEPNYAIRLQNQIGTVRFDTTLSAYKILNEIGALSAWRQGYQGQNILIAVIDSGIDIHNSKLRRNIFRNEADAPDDLIDEDGNGFVDDSNGWNFTSNNNNIVDEIGHGTSIAGIITGQNMDGESLGIAPDARILPIDIMSGSNGNEYDARQAVDYAIRMKAQIINNSWSITCSSYLASTFKEYEKENVIFVNSAGNVPIDVFENHVMLSSIDLLNFLNVGSTNLSGKLSAFSGFGKTINMWAPGEQIPVLSIGNDDRLKASGTSVSAAIVSGATALVWSAHPNESALQIVKRIKRGASKINGRSLISIDRSI
jgi:subtilisin family serine protease